MLLKQTVKTAIKHWGFFFYFNLCIKLKLDNVSCSFTPISFLSTIYIKYNPLSQSKLQHYYFN